MDLRFSISIPNAVGCEPEDRTPRHALIIWACVAVIACLLVASIVVAPVAQAAGQTALAVFVYKTFSYLCHQIPERSFHLAGHKFAVCSRCTGLYSGFALATLIYPLMRSLKRTGTPRLVWLVLASIPIAVDFLLGYFNIWQNTHLSRFLTGALLGSAAVFYIVPGLIELSSVIVERFRAKETPPSLSQL